MSRKVASGMLFKYINNKTVSDLCHKARGSSCSDSNISCSEELRDGSGRKDRAPTRQKLHRKKTSRRRKRADTWASGLGKMPQIPSSCGKRLTPMFSLKQEN